ncbi:glycosyltransferase family 4 protein [Rhizobium terrae]|uniref:glycosyltransferase family 4 protein n=1 Tax=Rhizobium terrae TaxID=2171756 RepID=UPI003857EB04
MMLGLRGIPGIQGGVEKHVEMLAQELAARAWDVEIIARRHYLADKASATWRGIRITPLWAPRSMFLEAFTHTLFGVFYAAFRRPDILHIHAIGPGLLAPLARFLGLKVVATHHGYDYDREKWSPLAKRVLRLGERLSMRFSNARIAVSRDVTETMKQRYGREVAHVPNGVTVRPSLVGKATLDRFGLQRRRYIVMVARFVPEKRQTDLIAAFEKLDRPDWKLALVGGADHHGTPYAKEIEAMAARVPNVVLTGFQSGEDLAALFSQAGLFVLPSLHEGMPISLLEAMSYGLPVLASDIVANHEVDLPPEDYFPAGNVDALAKALARKLDEPFGQEIALARIREVEQTYAWPSITRSTLAVYKSVLARGSRKERR